MQPMHFIRIGFIFHLFDDPFIPIMINPCIEKFWLKNDIRFMEERVQRFDNAALQQEKHYKGHQECFCFHMSGIKYEEIWGNRASPRNFFDEHGLAIAENLCACNATMRFNAFRITEPA
jgi:hypothetical protein